MKNNIKLILNTAIYTLILHVNNLACPFLFSIYLTLYKTTRKKNWSEDDEKEKSVASHLKLNDNRVNFHFATTIKKFNELFIPAYIHAINSHQTIAEYN